MIIKKDGSTSEKPVRAPEIDAKCSFERIYFSRGTDKDIYQERLELGRLVTKNVLKEIDYDLRNTVFSFIPNTAEMSYYGMLKATEDYLADVKLKKIKKLSKDADSTELKKILSIRTRADKIMVKDAKLRTFITQDDSRDEMVAHVYDITYGSIKRKSDSIVVIDDSIDPGSLNPM